MNRTITTAAVPVVSDVLAMLDDMNAGDRIEYSDYVALHNEVAGLAVPPVPEASREDVEALSEWGIDESDVAAIRGAALDGAAWALIDRTSDTADRGPSAETFRDALRDVSAAFPFLGAAPSAPACAGCGLAQREHQPGYAASRCAYTPAAVPSATREDLTGIINDAAFEGVEYERAERVAAYLHARFTITPRTDR